MRNFIKTFICVITLNMTNRYPTLRFSASKCYRLVCRRMIDFAGTEIPYEAEIKDNVEEIQKTILMEQTSIMAESNKKRVPLKFYFPHFQQVLIKDGRYWFLL